MQDALQTHRRVQDLLRRDLWACMDQEERHPERRRCPERDDLS